jgi:AraC-like DNA-binding protein
MFTVQHNIGGGPDALAEAFSSYLPCATIERCASPDNFKWTGTLASTHGRALWRIRSNGDWDFSSSTNELDSVFVTLPEHGGLKMTERGQERTAVPGQALVLNQPRVRDNCTFSAKGHEQTSLKWPRREAQHAISSVYGDVRLDDLDVQPVQDLDNDRGRVLVRLLSAIAIDLANPLPPSTLVSELINEAALRLLFEPAVSRWAERNGRKHHPHILPRHVKQAVDYMQVNAGRPIRIRDVADACCVTPRTLENGFKTFKGMTPIAYLTQVRLEAVRHELQTVNFAPRIFEIARRWGFPDPGRFAERYRRAFGELPSETLRSR